MSGANWSDLRTRILSGVVMAVVGISAVAIGGTAYQLLIAVCCGVMIWELAQIAAKTALVSLGLAAVTGFALFLLNGWDLYLIGPALLAPPLVLLVLSQQERLRVAIYAAMILGAGLSLLFLRQDLGLVWLLWLVLSVVATDIAGYFVGRTIGGPKFWPSLSPKKTWSGVVGGWVAAALVGMIFQGALFGPLVLLGVALSFASQLGDIAESAIKRKFGVKDSSNLIPGHGGFLDRFDAILAGSLLVGLVCLLVPSWVHSIQMGW